MQTQVMFYQLPEVTEPSEQSSNEADDNSDTIERFSSAYQACLQASYFYRQGQKVYIFCDEQQSAETIDELLWAFDSDSFVPHNLVGEGPKQGSAVEIGWQAPKGRKSVLINLSNTVPIFAQQFNFVVDFVPSDAALKQLARERFKTCRQWGFQVDTQAIAQ
ncbi:DNA polymerase III subunit chi [Litorilituus lipolyticus]|uniref:DNA polymerase III subunit chi n=1 Tax=Litorilituus lipolyticus TaxID=2491017 RepID=A0A502LEV6_9GAMM|nr:DNA polymerase III subunit chi [Litorilituus lipolyticus]TPH18507.1 DNA polymerase III subunit chi [Litorilituus lipolyticus]